MSILERYSTAIHASSLKIDPLTTTSNADVIAAAGFAAKHKPLGIALARMLSGGGTGDVIDQLADMGFRRARTLQIRMNPEQSRLVGISVLSWYRHGTCQPCGGTGYRIIPGTPSLGDECTHCRGTGRIDFESHFREDWRPLARWLHVQIEKNQRAAGDAVMRAIAPMLDF